MKNKFINALVFNWKISALGVICFAAILSLFSYNLTATVPGMMAEEAMLQYSISSGSLSLNTIFAEPTLLPYMVVLFLAQIASFESILTLRLISVVIGLITVGAFYYIMNTWLTQRMAAVSTLLFATSSWLLHIVRLGVPDAIFASSIIALALGLWLQYTKRRKPILVLVALSLIFIYVPGFIWLIAFGGIWQRKKLVYELKQSKLFFQIIFGLVAVSILTPLLIALATNSEAIVSILGLPNEIPSLDNITQRAQGLVAGLFYSGIEDQARWLPGTPLLSVLGVLLFTIGLYKCWLTRKLDRSRVVIGGLVFWSVLIVLGGQIPYAAITPLVFIVIGFGITLLLQQWLTVFPKNIIAQGFALGAISLVVALNVFYNINHYFIAWARSPETTQIFSLQPTSSDTIYDDQL